MAKNIGTIFTILIILFASCNNQNNKKNNEVLNINFDTIDLASDVNLLGDMPSYNALEAGASTKIERAFENAPPMIPHKTIMFLPITLNNNLCLSCHTPENAKGIGATAIPQTHFTNYRPDLVQKDGLYQVDAETNEMVSIELGTELNMARYNCTQCHAILANISVDIENYFIPDFRNGSSKKSSNLSKNIGEGVK